MDKYLSRDIPTPNNFGLVFFYFLSIIFLIKQHSDHFVSIPLNNSITNNLKPLLDFLVHTSEMSTYFTTVLPLAENISFSKFIFNLSKFDMKTIKQI